MFVILTRYVNMFLALLALTCIFCSKHKSSTQRVALEVVATSLNTRSLDMIAGVIDAHIRMFS